MIPLRDDVPSRTTPWVTRLLILLNVLAFLWELSAGERLSSFLLVPARVLENPSAVLTSMFLHGGWLHLLGNMLFLHIFGDNVEDRLGHVRYLTFYLLCGTAAAVAQIAAAPTSLVPMLGASGAIAGVLGGYFVLYPRARVLTIIPFFFFGAVAIPAVLYLGGWFLLQLASGVLSLGDQGGGVAFFAHAGGFVTGIVLVKLLDRGVPQDDWPAPDMLGGDKRNIGPRRRYV